MEGQSQDGLWGCLCLLRLSKQRLCTPCVAEGCVPRGVIMMEHRCFIKKFCGMEISCAAQISEKTEV